MTQILTQRSLLKPFPDHTQLPDEDGTFVKNFQEHPQSLILTDSIGPTFQRLHPDGQYCIGQDSGIYWRETDPPERGAEAPDWFYVPNVPPRLDGKLRRSYVFWRELISPSIALEFASGDGDEERDRTPYKGKFWVYEQIIKISYYGILDVVGGFLEVYYLSQRGYQKLNPNDRGHYPILPLGVELGLWRGTYQNNPEQLWLRWWDLEGNLLLIGDERANLEQQRTEQQRQRANLEQQRAQEERQRANLEQQRAQEERQRANLEQQRAQEEQQRAEEERQRALLAEEKAAKLAEQLRALGINPDA